MFRHPHVLVLVVLVLVLGAYSFITYRTPVPALASQISQAKSVMPTSPALAWPAYGEAAVGAEGYGVLDTHGTQAALPTASVAKVMTALAILKVKPLAIGEQGPTLTLTQADVNSYNTYVAEDGSVAKVTVGEKITEYQALEAMLLPSADNIADTLAIWAFGSIGTYSSYANTYAASIGMNDSHFGTIDASGYSPVTVSTAHDLVLLGQTALRNPVVAQIVDKSTATIPEAGKVVNVNWILGKDGINGIKTGNTDQAGGVYLFSAQQTFVNGQSVTVLGAIMDAPTLAQALDDGIPLLTSTEANFSLTTLVQAGQVMGTYSVPWIGTVNAVATKSLSTVTWQEQDIKPQVKLKSLQAPVAKGTQVGTASFSINSESVPITIDKTINSPTWHWRLQHVF